MLELQVGVKAIVQDNEGKILLLKRNKPFSKSNTNEWWDIVGGRIKVGEPHIEALRREIFEETGLSLKTIKDIFHVQDIIRTESNIHVVRVTYLVDTEGDIMLSDEHSEYQWLHPQDISVYETDNVLIDALKANKWI